MKYYDYTIAELWNIYNTSKEYDSALCKEICSRVGMYEDYYYAGSENVDRVMEEAAERLKEQL
jgi:hypothetical protein